MAYLLYAIVFLTIVTGTALYLTRERWLHAVPHFVSEIRLPGQGFLYSRLSGSSSFGRDIEAGLSSSTFDLAANVADGDGRAGLDDASKKAILKIMKKRRLRFDDARKVYMEQRFNKNGIGADGLPRDPKLVTFS